MSESAKEAFLAGNGTMTFTRPAGQVYEMTVRDVIYLAVRNKVIGKTRGNPYPEVSQLDLRDVDKITNIVCSLVNDGILTIPGDMVTI